MNEKLIKLLEKLNETAVLIDKIHSKNDWLYKSNESLVLRHGLPFINVIPSPFKGERKSCYKNCFEALWKNSKLYYCEGYGMQSDISLAFAHAWLLNEAGEVIDPTWSDLTISEKFVYYGLVFNRNFVFNTAKQTNVYGILENDYRNNNVLKIKGLPPDALCPKFNS
ncbi:MAG TPA: hypothetical protein V6D13_18435 [Halomicronema sp.]